MELPTNSLTFASKADEMNGYKKLLHFSTLAKMGEVGLENQHGIPDKYWPYILTGFGDLDHRSFKMDRPSQLRDSWGHKSRGYNREVCLEDLGTVTLNVNCCRKRHAISILPSGEMVLHEHEDDAKQREVFSALIGMTGEEKTKTRCEIIRDSYHSYLRGGRFYNGASSRNHHLDKLPKEFQRVATSRANLRVKWRARLEDEARDNPLWDHYEECWIDLEARRKTWLECLLHCYRTTVNVPIAIKTEFGIHFDGLNLDSLQSFYKEVYKTRRFWTVLSVDEGSDVWEDAKKNPRCCVLTRDSITSDCYPRRVLAYIPGRSARESIRPYLVSPESNIFWGWEYPSEVEVVDIPDHHVKANRQFAHGLHFASSARETRNLVQGWEVSLEFPKELYPDGR